MSEAYILILNRNSQEREYLRNQVANQGLVLESHSLENALHLAKSTPIHVVIVEMLLADYSSLRGIFDPATSFLITGREENKIKDIIQEWPAGHYLQFLPVPLPDDKNGIFLRTVATAAEHACLKMNVQMMPPALTAENERLHQACAEIRELKDFISSNVVKELRRRIDLEIKYLSTEKEKKKIQAILKKLYMADDVSSLLDIVSDIKDIIQASGITFYVLDENETLGKYLKPLVWDDTFLSHADFIKHIALIDSEDIAACVAREAEEIFIDYLEGDRRISERYTHHLKLPLTSLLAVPIKQDRKVIGVLEVYNKVARAGVKTRCFTQEDLHILRTLSEHISIAMTKLNLIQYDALTGLLRPDPFFETVLQKLNSQGKRRQEVGASAMVMGDVDWFKNYNDRNGHEAGNKLLRELAGVLKASIREEDVLCRYGGEEFLFFLAGVKNIEEACILTERIRRNVEEHYFEHEELQPRKNLTMSFGVTLFPKKKIDLLGSIIKEDLKEMAHEADMALAEAKGKKSVASGPSEVTPQNLVKNKVCMYFGRVAGRHGSEDIVRPYEEKAFREKRKHPRFFISTPLLIKDNGSFTVGKTINLSLGGAKIQSDLRLPQAQTIDLFIILENKAGSCRGDVIYSEKMADDPLSYHAGLRFKDLPFGDRKTLENYLAAFEKKSTLN